MSFWLVVFAIFLQVLLCMHSMCICYTLIHLKEIFEENIILGLYRLRFTFFVGYQIFCTMLFWFQQRASAVICIKCTHLYFIKDICYINKELNQLNSITQTASWHTKILVSSRELQQQTFKAQSWKRSRKWLRQCFYRIRYWRSSMVTPRNTQHLWWRSMPEYYRMQQIVISSTTSSNTWRERLNNWLQAVCI